MSRPEWLQALADACEGIEEGDDAWELLNEAGVVVGVGDIHTPALVEAADIVIALAEWYELVYTEHFGIAEQAVAWRQRYAQ